MPPKTHFNAFVYVLFVNKSFIKASASNLVIDENYFPSYNIVTHLSHIQCTEKSTLILKELGAGEIA